jgi:hypothetical protein
MRWSHCRPRWPPFRHLCCPLLRLPRRLQWPPPSSPISRQPSPRPQWLLDTTKSAPSPWSVSPLSLAIASHYACPSPLSAGYRCPGLHSVRAALVLQRGQRPMRAVLVHGMCRQSEPFLLEGARELGNPEADANANSPLCSERVPNLLRSLLP